MSKEKEKKSAKKAGKEAKKDQARKQAKKAAKEKKARKEKESLKEEQSRAERMALEEERARAEKKALKKARKALKEKEEKQKAEEAQKIVFSLVPPDESEPEEAAPVRNYADALDTVFSPETPKEFDRLLKKGGKLFKKLRDIRSAEDLWKIATDLGLDCTLEEFTSGAAELKAVQAQIEQGLRKAGEEAERLEREAEAAVQEFSSSMDDGFRAATPAEFDELVRRAEALEKKLQSAQTREDVYEIAKELGLDCSFDQFAENSQTLESIGNWVEEGIEQLGKDLQDHASEIDAVSREIEDQAKQTAQEVQSAVKEISAVLESVFGIPGAGNTEPGETDESGDSPSQEPESEDRDDSEDKE